ncbi:fluoride efflux transporter FluC [Microbacterium sp. GXF6406]
MTLRRLLLVMCGGMLGTAARLGIALLVPDIGGMPLATLLVNVLGALLIGVLAARLPSSSDARTFLGAGALGGFTTYSAFAVGTAALDLLPAIAYAALTLALGIVAAATGLRLGRTGERGSGG